eukprot:1154462-Pelagomonas_calceolata.AAC.5
MDSTSEHDAQQGKASQVFILWQEKLFNLVMPRSLNVPLEHKRFDSCHLSLHKLFWLGLEFLHVLKTLLPKAQGFSPSGHLQISSNPHASWQNQYRGCSTRRACIHRVRLNVEQIPIKALMDNNGHFAYKHNYLRRPQMLRALHNLCNMQLLRLEGISTPSPCLQLP